MMKRHDDPFFEHVRQELHGVEAPPPAGAYAGIRSKMGGNSFMRFSWYRMNVYYAALLVSGAIALALMNGSEQNTTSAQVAAGDDAISLSLERETANAPAEVQTTIEASLESEELTASVAADQPSAKAQSAAAKNTTETGNREVAALEENATQLTADEQTTTPPICPDDLQKAKDETTSDVQHRMSETAEVMQPLAARQLPNDWLNHAAQPDLSGLISDLQSDKETIFLTLPVKVSVEKED